MSETEPEDEYLWQQGDCILELPEWQEGTEPEPVSIKDVLPEVLAEIERRRQQKPERPLTQKEWYRTVYLESYHWKERSQRIREMYNYKCHDCRKREKLDVHHLNYERLGRELNEDLIPLCRECHELRHAHGELPEL